MVRRVLAIATADSRLKWSYRLGQEFEKRGADVWVNVPPEENLTVNSQMMRDVGITVPYTEHPWEQMAAPEVLGEVDVIIALMGSKDNWLFMNRIREVLSSSEVHRRPVLITGYAGVQLGNHVENLLWRVGFDIICVNSRHDIEIFSSILSNIHFSDEHLVRSGYIYANRGGPVHGKEGGPRTVVFATQPDMPQRKDERLYLLRRLLEYARAFPNRRVLIKPRIRPGDLTIHPESFPYPELFQQAGFKQPDNLEFVHGSMAQILKHADLLLTVSSTAAMESLARGIPTAIIGDLGIKESLGTHFFLRSGLITTFDALLRDEIPVPSSDWLERNGFSPKDSLENVVVRTQFLLNLQEDSKEMLPFPPVFYNEQTLPFRYHDPKKAVSLGTTPTSTRIRPPARGLVGTLLVLCRRWLRFRV